ncbi:MAG: ribosome biogenesis GTPase Der [Bdellovibrio sp.]
MTQRKVRSLVAIVGRPNVGKSSLFNLLTESRKALVKNEPGVTRDLIFEEAELWGKSFQLVDTGGITEAKDLISSLVRDQVSSFLKSADLLIFVVDGRDGIIPEDREVFRLIQESGKPFLLVVNKVDRASMEQQALVDFSEFGTDLYLCSFESRRNLTGFLEKLHGVVPESQSDPVAERRIAVVGKPNVGKSSLINWMLGESRVLVSERAGTTLDSIEIPFHFGGQSYTLVDTAGLRRSSSQREDLEVLSSIKARQAIEKADLVLLVIDVTEGPTDQDARILQMILESHRAVLVVASKMDLGEDAVIEAGSGDSVDKKSPSARVKEAFRSQCGRQFHFFSDVEICFISSFKKFGLPEMFRKIDAIFSKLDFSVSTSELNDFFMESIRKAPSPVYGTTNVKFYYLTQTEQSPPSFIAFANHPELKI